MNSVASEVQTLPAVPSMPLRYVLVTPARNEAEFIKGTLESVIAQTVLPLKWIIVSDGSTDATDEIVAHYAERHHWIELIRMPERETRHFAGKVQAFNAGYAIVQELNYDAIGSLDADISFDADYFAFLLSRLAKDPSLGVVGTPFLEEGKSYDYRFTSVEHVSGACQLFRRQCFEAVGGYVPTPVGGVDLIAVITARMKGWQTRAFPEKTCQHHRNMGKAKHGRLITALKGGRGDYMLGGHPAWEICRSIYQMTRRPWFFAGCLRLIGYTWAIVTRTEKLVSDDLVKFRRAEQMNRLKTFFARMFTTVAAKIC